jgi:hypothetical protein
VRKNPVSVLQFHQKLRIGQLFNTLPSISMTSAFDKAQAPSPFCSARRIIKAPEQVPKLLIGCDWLSSNTVFVPARMLFVLALGFFQPMHFAVGNPDKPSLKLSTA